MRNIIVIAKNTFKEAVRDRILYGILAFALIYILSVLFLAKLSLGNLVMIRSFGLAGIYVFGALLTISLGSSIINKEIERRTLYFVLSKPVYRGEVIVGKFLGLLGAVAVTITLMTVVYLGVVLYEKGGFDTSGLLAVLFEIMEMAFFVAILIFLSTFTAPLTATICAVIVLFIGHLLNSALQTAGQIGGALFAVVKALYYVFPNLEKFNIRNLVVHQVTASATDTLLTLLYATIYITLLLYLAVLIFEKREL